MTWYLVILAAMAVPAAVSFFLRKRGVSSAANGALLTACIILLFFMAFRSETVGADTKQYTAAFVQLRGMSFGECLTGTRSARLCISDSSGIGIPDV